MTKTLPDKWIRKAVKDALAGLVVSSKEINVYDSRTGKESPSEFILITTQSNEVDKATKCDYRWRSTLDIEVVTRAQNPGNTTGNRVLADDILDAAKTLIHNMSLDVASGLSIITQTQSFPPDININTTTEIVNRKFLRLELLIN